MTEAVIFSIALGFAIGFAIKHLIDKSKIDYLETQIDVTKNIMRTLGEYALQIVNDYNELAGYEARQFDPFNLTEVLRKDK